MSDRKVLGEGSDPLDPRFARRDRSAISAANFSDFPDPMAKSNKRYAPQARLPRGLSDTSADEVRGAARMLGVIREVYESYGFEPLETPAIEYTDALGKFLPDQDRPNEGVFSFQDEDEQWLSLRYDLTAPLARYVAAELRQAAQALPALRRGPRVAQREAGARPLPPVHPVRRRHGGHGQRRRRRRDLHAGGRHAGGAGHPARRNTSSRSTIARCSTGCWQASASIRRRRRTRPSGSPCCAPSTSSTGWASDGVAHAAGQRAARTRCGDFTPAPVLSQRRHRNCSVSAASR